VALFRHGGFGFHVGEWLAVALVIVILFALCIALLRLVGLFKRKGDTDESESDYWRIHGG
jgi:heme exporter protein D